MAAMMSLRNLDRQLYAVYLKLQFDQRLVFDVPSSDDDKRSKNNALTEDGTLNPAPEKVRDPKF